MLPNRHLYVCMGVFFLEGKTMTKEKKQPIIVVDSLVKTYLIGTEKVRALRGVSLEIYRGEFVVILGTSGSGKSTFLNLLAGLEKPTSGSVTILGKKMSMSERKLAKFRQNHIGFIFQNYNLLTTMTALENVALPLVFKGVGAENRRLIALKLLKKVGLASHYKHKPTQMSGGQQQRVGIARAFAASPEIVFADEPTGNLDTRTSGEVMGILREMIKKNNQTMIFVTHDPEIAKYADKVVHIIDGQIDHIEMK